MESDSIDFAEWIEKNNWQAIHSKVDFKWVDAKIHTVYVNGSDYHFSKLYKNHAITTSELYLVFDDERRKKNGSAQQRDKEQG